MKKKSNTRSQSFRSIFTKDAKHTSTLQLDKPLKPAPRTGVPKRMRDRDLPLQQHGPVLALGLPWGSRPGLRTDHTESQDQQRC